MTNDEKEVRLNQILKKYNYKKKEELGKGGFGNVYLISAKGNEFALKVVEVESKKEKLIHNVEIEFSIAKELNSKYCIKTYIIKKDIIDKINIYSLVMENAYYKDLNHFMYYIHQNLCFHLNNSVNAYPQICNINFMTIKFFAQQFIKVLDFLYNHNIIHCDIKAENILLGILFTIKISDFSLIKKKEKNKNIILNSSTWNIKGPEYYTCNKEVKNKNSSKIDIFGFGLILYYMIFKKHVLNDKDKLDNILEIDKKREFVIQQINDSIQNIKNADNELIDDELKKLIISMIEPDIDKRVNLYDLCKNKWIHKDTDIMKKIEYVNADEEIKKFKEFQKLKNENNYEKLPKRKRKKFVFNKS
jgi:serine/threonine protein kinase